MRVPCLFSFMKRFPLHMAYSVKFQTIERYMINISAASASVGCKIIIKCFKYIPNVGIKHDKSHVTKKPDLYTCRLCKKKLVGTDQSTRSHIC